MSKKILISGGGIAGLTLAYWLDHRGFSPTVVEYAPRLREGGYLIDFFGSGFDVAEKMGIVEGLRAGDIPIPEFTFVDVTGARLGGWNAEKIRKRMQGRACSLLRSSLARILYERIKDRVPIKFGKTVRRVETSPEKVSVLFEDHDWDAYDLVVGADGVHSNIRRLVLGDQAVFERYCGYYAASYAIGNESADTLSCRIYSVPGRQATLYSLGKNKSAAFFAFKMPYRLSYDHHDIPAQKKLLNSIFGNEAWECRRMLEGMAAAPDFYFDAVSQIQMETWSRGRVALVGDACACPSLLAGEGASLAMTGAYVLAGELKKADGDYRAAFRNYEKELHSLVTDRQRLARAFASAFVPGSEMGILLRNLASRFMTPPLLSKLAIGRMLYDKYRLKEY